VRLLWRAISATFRVLESFELLSSPLRAEHSFTSNSLVAQQGGGAAVKVERSRARGHVASNSLMAAPGAIPWRRRDCLKHPSPVGEAARFVAECAGGVESHGRPAHNVSRSHRVVVEVFRTRMLRKTPSDGQLLINPRRDQECRLNRADGHP